MIMYKYVWIYTFCKDINMFINNYNGLEKESQIEAYNFSYMSAKSLFRNRPNPRLLQMLPVARCIPLSY